MIKYYTGVGSRKTPEHILNIMRQIAIAKARLYETCRTGDAMGADQAFRDAASAASCMGNNGESILNPHTDIPDPPMPEVYVANDATKEAMELVSKFHQAWNRCSTYAKRLHGRNAFQVLGRDLNTPSQHVICWTPDGCKSHATRSIKTGGTGTAISIADHFNIPVYNLANKEDYDYWCAWLAEQQTEHPTNALKYIYTAHYRYSGPDRTDITLKGQDPNGKYFAPTKEMVHGVLYHGMSEQVYVDRYVEILKTAPIGAWNWLLSKETRTFVCFCRQENFCHRNILAHYLLSILGDRVKYMGWRN